MSQTTALAGVAKHLHGGACLSQRSILLACDLFHPVKAPKKPLRLGDLLEALWFLDLAIVSKRISYDGTLPQIDIEHLTNRLDPFCQNSGFSDGHFVKVEPATFRDQLGFMCSAGAKALDDVGDGQTPSFGPQVGLDRPFDDDEATAFFGKLDELQREASGSRDGIHVEHLEELAKSGLRGGKCIAGIAASGPKALDQARSIPSKLAISPGFAMATLVNRFRFSYVRQLAFVAGDVYVPPTRWRPLSKFHAKTFADVVRAHFEEQHLQGLKDEIETELNAEVALPPLGLYALMKAPSRATPADVVRAATAEFEDYGKLFRKFWAETRKIKLPKNSWSWTVATNEQGMDEVHERVEQQLQDKLGQLLSKAGRKNPSVVDRFIGPVITTLGFAAGAGVLFKVQGFLGNSMESVMAASPVAHYVRLATERLGREATACLTGHVDDYRRLERDLSASIHGSHLRPLAEKVESVFKRTLV